MNTLLKTLISSTIIDFSFSQLLKEELEKEENNQDKSKIKLLENIMNICAYLNQDQLILVSKFCQIISQGKENKYKQVLDESNVSIMSNNSVFQINDEMFGKDINLSLNSHRNSVNKEDLIWGIEEKGI